MKSVLAGFLGTFASRYSDYQGYWLLGLVEPDLDGWTVDLLGPALTGGSPAVDARRLAIRRFAEQVSKSGLDLGLIREAVLNATVAPGTAQGWHGDVVSAGRRVRFFVHAVMDNGHVYEAEQEVFVAPHDPELERRRLPDSWGT